MLTPVLHQISARQQLKSYKLTAQKISGPVDSVDGITSTVTVDHQQYRAVLRAQSYGYRLTLKLLAAATQSTPTQGATFDALSNARTFLHAHALDNNLQEDAVDVQNGVTTVTFGSYLSHVYKVMGAGAVLTYTNSGTLVSADVHVVDDSTAFVTNGISVDTALNEVAGGYGLIASEGNVVPDQTASITGTAITYVPVSSQGTSFLEPMYQFSGITGNGLRFEVYVPAIDRAYLR